MSVYLASVLFRVCLSASGVRHAWNEFAITVVIDLHELAVVAFEALEAAKTKVCESE